MKELERKLGHSFTDKTLLSTALTHSSYANERRGENLQCNERLEFLGDSILGHIVAEHLYKTCPDMPEGGMTRMRAEQVCEQSLVLVATELKLGDYMNFGRGEDVSGGRERPSILADCVEAVLAAIYLDSGIEKAYRFVEKFILSRAKKSDTVGDHKTALQELVQRNGSQTLSYELVSESGPDHQKTFTAQVSVNGKPLGTGTGHSKKEAEQSAARAALSELGE